MQKISKCAVLFGIALLSTFVYSQEIEQDAMMKAWQESMIPGPQHEMLAQMVGEWNGEITMWMDPAQPPQTYDGHVVYESIFDGKYVVGKFSSTMMEMPFSGMDINGYDNIKKVFFTTWIDNMGTGLLYVEGTYDENSKTITYTGDTLDPMGNKMKVRDVVTLIDKDNSKFEMYIDYGSGEMKSMEITYTRK